MIAFVFEAEISDEEAALRKLVLDFLCAEKHRRALGMSDGPMFGAIPNEGVIQIYVSYRRDDEMVCSSLSNGRSAQAKF